MVTHGDGEATQTIPGSARFCLGSKPPQAYTDVYVNRPLSIHCCQSNIMDSSRKSVPDERSFAHSNARKMMGVPRNWTAHTSRRPRELLSTTSEMLPWSSAVAWPDWLRNLRLLLEPGKRLPTLQYKFPRYARKRIYLREERAMRS